MGIHSKDDDDDDGDDNDDVNNHEDDVDNDKTRWPPVCQWASWVIGPNFFFLRLSPSPSGATYFNLI